MAAEGWASWFCAATRSIGGGLGDLRGKVWRIGLMGESSTPGNVFLFLSSLAKILREQGYAADGRAALSAASARIAAG